jgi:hypothetical protein
MPTDTKTAPILSRIAALLAVTVPAVAQQGSGEPSPNPPPTPAPTPTPIPAPAPAQKPATSGTPNASLEDLEKRIEALKHQHDDEIADLREQIDKLEEEAAAARTRAQTPSQQTLSVFNPAITVFGNFLYRNDDRPVYVDDDPTARAGSRRPLDLADRRGLLATVAGPGAHRRPAAALGTAAASRAPEPGPRAPRLSRTFGGGGHPRPGAQTPRQIARASGGPAARTGALQAPFRGNDEVVRVRVKGLGDQCLADVGTVRVGRVDEVDAELDGAP